MEENKLYEMEYVNGELVIPELLDTDGNPVVVTVEEEEDSNKSLIGAGAAIIGIAATLYVARKPIKKVFKATRKAFKEFKSELSRPEEEFEDVIEVEVEEETEA